MCVIGFGLDHVAEALAHLLGKPESEVVLQDESDTALAGLAVDTDDVSVIAAPDIRGIDRDVGNGPLDVVVSCAVRHALGDGILMGSGKCSEYQSSAVRGPRVDVHAGVLFVLVDDLQHVVKIQLRIHSLAVHIQSQSHYVNIAGALTVSEDRSFDTVCSCQKAHLRVSDTGAAVIVRMQ